MSKTAAAWYTEQWIAGVNHDFQSEGFLLQGTVMPPVKIVGDTAHWYKQAAGTAKKYTPGNTVQPLNAGKSTVSKVLEIYDAPEYAYVNDVNRTTAGERDGINEMIGMAIGRQFDQLIIDEMDATAGLTQVGAVTTAFSLATALSGIQQLQKAVKRWKGNVYCAIPSNPWAQLLTYSQFASADWVGGDLPFTKMTDHKFWNGVHFMLFPDDQLPLALTDDRTFFMWHERAIGFAHADMENLTGTVDWVPTERGWLHQAWIDANAKVVVPEGIIEFLCDDDAAITVS